MKKFMILIMLVFTLNTMESYSDCPEGFEGPTTSNFVTCAGCFVTVSFCTRWNDILESYDIFINEIGYVETPSGACLCGATVPPGAYHGPAVDDIFLGILNTNEATFGDVAGLMECPMTKGNSITEEQTLRRMRVFTGGCYIYSPPGYPDNKAKYTICNPYLFGECNEYYEVCKVWVVDHYERTVRSVGLPTATFDCDNEEYEVGCVTICR